MAIKNVTLFLNRPKNILKAFGVWLTPDSCVVLRRFYLFLILLTQYNFVLFEFIYIANVWGDLDEVSEASYLVFTQASVCYKCTVFLLNKKNLVKLLDFMEDKIFAPQSKEHERMLVVQSRTIKRLCMFFLTSAITTCSLWACIPLFDNVGNRSFPFKIWMPVGPENSPQYELGYIYQMASIYISAFLFIGVDSVTLSMIMFGCAQLEIIMDKMKKLQVVPLSARLKPEERHKRIKENNELFIECIKHHQALVRFIELVENSYHANIFFQLSGTVGIICIIGLRISIASSGQARPIVDFILTLGSRLWSRVEKNSVQFFSMINYLVTMLSQLFLYCWCGNELTIRSQNLRDWLYQCPWYEQDIKFRRSLWIAMERMKKPIIFKAGHYIPLSRPTFVSILRSSYSYFAVLNQANSK